MAFKLIRTNDYTKVIRLVHIQLAIKAGTFSSYAIEQKIKEDVELAKDNRVYKIEGDGGAIVGFLITKHDLTPVKSMVKKQFDEAVVAAAISGLLGEMV